MRRKHGERDSLQLATERVVAHVLLLPGLDGTGELWSQFIDCLPDEVEITGVSYPQGQLLGYEELAAWVRKAAPDEPYVLIAESFSGPLAIQFAAEGPAGLVGLILCATFAANPLPWWLHWISFLPIALLLRLPIPRMAVRALLVGWDGDPARVDRVLAATKQAEPKVLAHRIAQVLAVDVRASLGRIQVPVLYLMGTRDRLVGTRGFEQVASALPATRCLRFDGPHLLFQCKAQATARAVLEFQSEVSSD